MWQRRGRGLVRKLAAGVSALQNSGRDGGIVFVVEQCRLPGRSVRKTAAGVSALQNGGWGGGVAPVAEPCHLPRHRAQAGSTQEALHLEQLLL